MSLPTMQREQEGLAAQLAALPKHRGRLLGLLTVEALPAAGDDPASAGTAFTHVAAAAAGTAAAGGTAAPDVAAMPPMAPMVGGQLLLPPPTPAAAQTAAPLAAAAADGAALEPLALQHPEGHARRERNEAEPEPQRTHGGSHGAASSSGGGGGTNSDAQPPPVLPPLPELPTHLQPPPPRSAQREGSMGPGSDRQPPGGSGGRARHGPSDSRSGAGDGDSGGNAKQLAAGQQQQRPAGAGRHSGGGGRGGRSARHRPKTFRQAAAKADQLAARQGSRKRARRQVPPTGASKSDASAPPAKRPRNAAALGTGDAAATAEQPRHAAPLGSGSVPGATVPPGQPRPLFSPPECSGVPPAFRNLSIEFEEALVALLQVRRSQCAGCRNRLFRVQGGSMQVLDVAIGHTHRE